MAKAFLDVVQKSALVTVFLIAGQEYGCTPRDAQKEGGVEQGRFPTVALEKRAAVTDSGALTAQNPRSLVTLPGTGGVGALSKAPGSKWGAVEQTSTNRELLLRHYASGIREQSQGAAQIKGHENTPERDLPQARVHLARVGFGLGLGIVSALAIKAANLGTLLNLFVGPTTAPQSLAQPQDLEALFPKSVEHFLSENRQGVGNPAGHAKHATYNMVGALFGSLAGLADQNGAYQSSVHEAHFKNVTVSAGDFLGALKKMHITPDTSIYKGYALSGDERSDSSVREEGESEGQLRHGGVFKWAHQSIRYVIKGANPMYGMSPRGFSG